MPYAVLMPIFADSILGGGARSLGILMAASGLGALGGALSLAARRGVSGLGQWVAVSAASFGITLALFSLSRNFWLSTALMVPVGFSLMVEMASSNTLIQAMVPDRLRGRVMSVYSMMFLGMAPFGGLAAGYAAERIGAPATIAARRRHLRRRRDRVQAAAAVAARRSARTDRRAGTGRGRAAAGDARSGNWAIRN